MSEKLRSLFRELEHKHESYRQHVITSIERIRLFVENRTNFPVGGTTEELLQHLRYFELSCFSRNPDRWRPYQRFRVGDKT